MVFIIVLLVHQAIMVMPLRMTAPVMAATSRSNIALPCDGACPSGVISLCIPGHICAGVVAALTRLPFSSLMPLLLLIVTLMAIRTPTLALRRERWFWPPDRRRALLQVFLI